MSLRDLLHGSVLQCLVRSSMDNRAKFHLVCSAASTESKYGESMHVHGTPAGSTVTLHLSFPCSRAVFVHRRTTSLGPVALHLSRS
mmetsp:Transcript_26700/g.36706  ORF Transcript_26700/g.36706 Transcript_26700/m.36706 type:complete len:86 (-) Transcript_26700:7-264(-)